MRQKAWRDRASRNDGFYQNGIQKGEQNKAAAVARKALAEGMAVELISKITGLDPETIRGL
jgi:hypothetical protein